MPQSRAEVAIDAMRITNDLAAIHCSNFNFRLLVLGREASLLDAVECILVGGILALGISGVGGHVDSITFDLNGRRITATSHFQVTRECPLTNTPVSDWTDSGLAHARKLPSRAPVWLARYSAKIRLHSDADMVRASILRSEISTAAISCESSHCHAGLRAIFEFSTQDILHATACRDCGKREDENLPQGLRHG